MDFSEIIGHDHLKAHLLNGINTGRIAHAQLFVGNHGSGVLPMAIAYANELLCGAQNTDQRAKERCKAMVSKLAHPDLHFVFPVNKNQNVKKHPVSDLFLEEWRNFIAQNPYGSLFDWLQLIGIENKQGNISVDEAADLSKKLSLKSYEGGYKIFIIWMADKMNTACANKILKMVEEPPQNTILLLITENEEKILGTIHSRCQKLYFPALSEEVLINQLISSHGLSKEQAVHVAHRSNGDYYKTLELLKKDGEDHLFEQWFIKWVRAAFSAKGNKKAINDLLIWSQEISTIGRETQKKFLSYCIHVFRQGLLKNYKADSLLYMETQDPKFSISKFAPFIHQNNIFQIVSAIETASYHIERNGNAKLILTDLSIELTRLIHKKELA